MTGFVSKDTYSRLVSWFIGNDMCMNFECIVGWLKTLIIFYLTTPLPDLSDVPLETILLWLQSLD
jgi:hypothetical protein